MTTDIDYGSIIIDYGNKPQTIEIKPMTTDIDYGSITIDYGNKPQTIHYRNITIGNEEIIPLEMEITNYTSI